MLFEDYRAEIEDRMALAVVILGGHSVAVDLIPEGGYPNQIEAKAVVFGRNQCVRMSADSSTYPAEKVVEWILKLMVESALRRAISRAEKEYARAASYGEFMPSDTPPHGGLEST